MNSFLEIMLLIYNGLYQPLLEALNMLPMLNIDLLIGVNGTFTIAELIATSLTISLYAYVTILPIRLIYYSIKKVMGTIYD